MKIEDKSENIQDNHDVWNRLNINMQSKYIALYINADNEPIRIFWITDKAGNSIETKSEALKYIENNWKEQKIDNVEKILLLYCKYHFDGYVGEVLCSATINTDSTLTWNNPDDTQDSNEAYVPRMWMFEMPTKNTGYLYCSGRYPTDKWNDGEKKITEQINEMKDRQYLEHEFNRLCEQHSRSSLFYALGRYLYGD